MPRNDFTERTQRVLALARDEAVDLDHEYVGTEHLLLGLLAEGNGVAAAVLQNLGADAGAMRALVVEIATRGKRPPAAGSTLPYTTRAKQALDLARAEARGLNHGYVGTEHLLLGLLREENGIGAQVLVRSGVTWQRARTETNRLLGPERPLGDPGAG